MFIHLKCLIGKLEGKMDKLLIRRELRKMHEKKIIVKVIAKCAENESHSQEAENECRKRLSNETFPSCTNNISQSSSEQEIIRLKTAIHFLFTGELASCA